MGGGLAPRGREFAPMGGGLAPMGGALAPRSRELAPMGGDLAPLKFISPILSFRLLRGGCG